MGFLKIIFPINRLFLCSQPFLHTHHVFSSWADFRIYVSHHGILFIDGWFSLLYPIISISPSKVFSGLPWKSGSARIMVLKISPLFRAVWSFKQMLKISIFIHISFATILVNFLSLQVPSYTVEAPTITGYFSRFYRNYFFVKNLFRAFNRFFIFFLFENRNKNSVWGFIIIYIASLCK